MAVSDTGLDLGEARLQFLDLSQMEADREGVVLAEVTMV